VRARTASAWFVASVWLVHGLYNKLLGGSPRHLAIVQSVPWLAGTPGARVLIAIGMFEVVVALWVLSAWTPRLCAATQTGALLSMNIIELAFARHLLLWPAGLVPLNVAFLALAWSAAELREPWRLRTWLRRHPTPIEAHFRDCLTLTYAVPPEVLRPLVPPGLRLETLNGYGFMAIALVRTESLRPAGLPKACGQDFFLAGYRVFTTFHAPGGRRLRGLRILRTDTDRTRMVAAGNLLTHYNYHRCEARIESSTEQISVAVDTADHNGDLHLTAHLSKPTLPPGSPLHSWREAMRFAGPLPFTFDYEGDTHAIIAVQATRSGWRPAPVAVDVHRISFFDQPMFHGCTPILAAAFHGRDIDYRWERGVRYPLAESEREKNA
jgi:uncharacterized protein YqjF (DUF2071 family)